MYAWQSVVSPPPPPIRVNQPPAASHQTQWLPLAIPASRVTTCRDARDSRPAFRCRAILAEVKATRTPQEIAQFGTFLWEEAIGPRAEVIFIGQGAPATTTRPTVVVILRTGQVYRMLPTGLTAIVSQGPPKEVSYDLQLGQAQLMVS